MNEQTMRFRVGIFVLGMLVLLAVLILTFSASPTFLKRHREYTVVFPQAYGIEAGTPVRRSGVRIGDVKSVALDDETGKVRVTILVDTPHTISQGDQPTLVHGLLGGDATIDFVARKPAPPEANMPVEAGAEITGVTSPDAFTLLNQASELVPSTQQNLNDMRKSLQHFEEMIPDLRHTNEEAQVAARNWSRLGERLNVLLQTNQDKLVSALDHLNDTITRVGRVFSDENQRNLSATLKNVRASSDSLDSVTRNTDQLLKESRETIQRINTALTRTDEIFTNLQQATKPMAERSGAVMKNLDESTERLNRTLEETRVFLRTLNQSDGTIGHFLNDPALYNNLNEAASELVRILPRVDRMMHDMEVFADKLARHPESIGLGGVVSPSGGLKEAPASWQRR